MCLYVIYICQNYNRVVALQAYTDDGVPTDLDDFEDWKIDPLCTRCITHAHERENKTSERKKGKISRDFKTSREYYKLWWVHINWTEQEKEGEVLLKGVVSEQEWSVAQRPEQPQFQRSKASQWSLHVQPTLKHWHKGKCRSYLWRNDSAR